MFTKSSLVFLFLFIFTIGMRWVMAPRLLPQTWTENQEVIITARVFEEPTPTGTNYIIRLGRVRAVFSSLVRVSPGDVVSVSGKVQERVILGKIVQITLYNPTIVVVESGEVGELSPVDKLRLGLISLRSQMTGILARSLPEPHSSLSAGILLGVRASMPDSFYQALVDTGTLHVIAASGYNVSIVVRVVMGLALLWFSRGVAIVVGLLAVVSYVILAGGSAAVVRAGVMGILAYSAYIWGRPVNAKRLLWLAVWGMLLIDPLLLVDVGFQLSVAATWGILYLEPRIRQAVVKWKLGRRNKKLLLEGYLADTLYPTLAATISTMPIILIWFGRVSYISPIVNILVLWLVPIIMFVTSLLVIGGLLVPWIGSVVAVLVYVPLAVFVGIVELMARVVNL